MSRTIIWGAVTAVIIALTATAYFVTGTSLDEAARKSTRDQVVRAQNLLTQTARLEALGLQKDAERLSIDPGLLRAVKTEASGERASQSNLAFGRFNASATDATKPDILALVDATGDIVSMYTTTVPPKEWKDKGRIVWPAVDLVLSKRIVISEIWDYPNRGLMRVGVAPVIDVEAPVPPGDQDGVVIVGAVVLAYAMTSAQAVELERNLGTDVAYFNGGRVDATSLGNDGGEAQRVLGGLLGPPPKGKNLGDPRTGVVEVSIGGHDYLAASARVPRSASKPLPGPCTDPAKTDNCYPPVTSGAIVLMTPDPGVAGNARKFILLVGIGALVIAMLGLYLANRRLLAQVDQIEVGVADIINGNVDRTFRPVGQELDGLANGLNVMLARLLGRPEPGEEELDDDGNPIVQGRVEFDDQAVAPGTDPELARLAQEPEPDYYKRLFTEYKAARQSTGQPDEGSFENFIAKLKVNEGKLKAQYQSRAVRFRVVTKDGKVTLKPVPIL